MQLIPAIDLKDGQCVRLYQGDFAAQTRYPDDPESLLEKYRLLGAAWLHVVDLDGARDGAEGNATIVRALAARQTLEVQAGGGVRDTAALRRMFDLGAARCVIGSAALTDPVSVRGWLKRFGTGRIVLAFDVRLDAEGIPRVTTHGWTHQSTQSLWEAVGAYSEDGLTHVLCTDVGRDGTLGGPNLELYREAVQRFGDIDWQASGGIRDGADLAALAATGVAAAVSGRALLEHRIPLAEMKPFLPNA
jgi:phosphoribosylformimino-5-aminoimidazole carboxamide ribotide isomerase